MSSMPPFMVRKTSVVILCTILTCIHLYFLITGQAVLPGTGLPSSYNLYIIWYQRVINTSGGTRLPVLLSRFSASASTFSWLLDMSPVSLSNTFVFTLWFVMVGVSRLLLPWLPYGYISLLIGFWSILNPEKGIVPTFWTHLRVPAAFMGLVAMMCTIRLFYWAYLDMVDPDDDIQTTVELPMNVSKIQLPSTSPQIGSE